MLKSLQVDSHRSMSCRVSLESLAIGILLGTSHASLHNSPSHALLFPDSDADMLLICTISWVLDEVGRSRLTIHWSVVYESCSNSLIKEKEDAMHLPVDSPK